MTQQDVQLFSLSQPQQRIWYTELLYPNRNTSTIIATGEWRFSFVNTCYNNYN